MNKKISFKISFIYFNIGINVSPVYKGFVIFFITPFFPPIILLVRCGGSESLSVLLFMMLLGGDS